MELDVHPDMRELIAGKRVVPTTDDSNVMRPASDRCGARVPLPCSPEMAVSDTSFEVAEAPRRGLALRFYRLAGAREAAEFAIG